MYSLLKAIRTVKYVDTSQNRLNVFEDISRKHALIRIAYLTFQRTADTPLGPVLLLLYGLKCYMTIKFPTQKSMELLCFASYPNEHLAVNRIKREISEIDHGDVFISRKYVVNPTNWPAAFRYFLIIPRLYGFAKYCSNHLHFMPACRVFSTLAFYLRFKQLLGHIDTKGVLVANHYSPECTALAAAAKCESIKVIFTNHAYIPAKSINLPSADADLSLLTSQAVYEKLIGKSKRPIRYKLIGSEQKKEQLRLNFAFSSKVTAGIFLTALTDRDHIRNFVDRFHSVLPSGRILIRPHPVALLKDNFSVILQDFSFVEISRNTPLSSDINKCDLAVCGNTSAVIEILKGGCPVLYDAELDQITYDYNGFVQGGLIMPVEKIDKQILSKISEFYRRAEWEKNMQFYDASYLEDRNKLLREAETEIKQVLNEESVCKVY